MSPFEDAALVDRPNRGTVGCDKPTRPVGCNKPTGLVFFDWKAAEAQWARDAAMARGLRFPLPRTNLHWWARELTASIGGRLPSQRPGGTGAAAASTDATSTSASTTTTTVSSTTQETASTTSKSTLKSRLKTATVKAATTALASKLKVWQKYETSDKISISSRTDKISLNDRIHGTDKLDRMDRASLYRQIYFDESILIRESEINE
ncbi:uncharacterized protein LOC108666959 isoform X2 [Hyalella azteca]|uniref:Uncharacterized protein LOC108666959 isoform X2 n=1 Tax=Hyalella azteca TaxID=294128 RepID=A0A8B7N854_HYAAZ|nr:uncharacterized protein LOC108666959 isoform X2 [Hyalella azteca]